MKAAWSDALSAYLNPRHFLYGFSLFTAYFAANEIAFQLFAAPAIFPIAGGVALAGLVLGGLSLAPAIFFAAFIGFIWHGGSPSVALVIALANTIQAVLGASLLSLMNFNPLMRRLRDMFALMFVAVFGSMIVPTLGTLGYEALDAFNPVQWRTWWIGHMFSLLIVSPFIIRWLAKPRFNRSRAQALETLAALGLLVVLNILLAWADVTNVFGISMVYFVLIPFFWIALRLGPRFMSTALVLTAVITLSGAVLGPAASDAAGLAARLVNTQLFVNVLAVIFFILVAIEDERRQAVSSLRDHVQKLQNAVSRISSENRAKSEFLATLAHELRNPLAPLRSMIELYKLKGERASDEFFEIANASIGTMARLLDDLLDVSRISQKKFKLRKEEIEVCRIVERAVNNVNPQIAKGAHAFSIEVPSLPIRMLADPVRVEQIVINLLNNAIKYTPPGGSIHVSVAREGSHAVLRVRDSGIGIEPHMLDRVFDPFVQAASLEARAGSGLGIGLSLTKTLTEMHGGTIEARSRGAGQGSEFIVRLPALAATEPSPRIVQPERKRFAKLASRKILIVDDHAIAAESLARLLKLMGHDVQTSNFGVESIQVVKEFRPDIVLLDIGLPDMNGYEVARILRTIERYSGVLVAVTGYGQEEDKRRALDVGFDEQLTKPVGVADLERVFARFSDAADRVHA